MQTKKRPEKYLHESAKTNKMLRFNAVPQAVKKQRNLRSALNKFDVIQKISRNDFEFIKEFGGSAMAVRRETAQMSDEYAFRKFLAQGIHSIDYFNEQLALQGEKPFNNEELKTFFLSLPKE